MIFKKSLTTLHISRNFLCEYATPLQGFERINICKSSFARVAVGEHFSKCHRAFECINICDSSLAGMGPRASSQIWIQHVATLNMEMPMMMVMIVMRMMDDGEDDEDDEDDEDGSKGQFAERNMTP